MKRNATIRMLAAVLLMLCSAMHAQVPPPPALGSTASKQPDILRDVRIQQRLGNPLPLDAAFRDETGRAVRLGDYFGRRPVVLTLGYYQCPMLCNQVLNGTTSALSTLKFDIGKEFDVVSVSIDPRETPAMAAAKKVLYLQRYGRAGAGQGWHFLTGDQPAIDAVTSAAGFHYAWDQRTQQFAHASAIMVVTPEGKLAQYHYGIEYSPRDLRLALIESSNNKIGTLVDQLTLYCYHYDPAAGRYGAVVMNMLRVAAAATVLLLGGFMLLMFRREHARATTPAGGRAT